MTTIKLQIDLRNSREKTTFMKTLIIDLKIEKLSKNCKDFWKFWKWNNRMKMATIKLILSLEIPEKEFPWKKRDY